MRSAPSLTLEPGSTRIGPALLLAALLLSLGAIWMSALMVHFQWALSGLVVALGLHRTLKPVPTPSRAVLQSDGVWMLEMAGAGEQVPATLESSTLLAGLISLTWRSERDGRRHTLLLWPDALKPNSTRQLRVWLRSGRAHTQTTTPAPLSPEGIS
jgi:hypothetical protein